MLIAPIYPLPVLCWRNVQLLAENLREIRLGGKSSRLRNLCNGIVRSFKEMSGLVQPAADQIIDRRDSLIFFESVNHIIFIHIGQPAQHLKGNIFRKMFIQILFNKTAFSGGFVNRSAVQRRLCVPHQQKQQDLQKILTDFRIMISFVLQLLKN